MKKLIAVLVIVAMAVVGMAGAANYMYEKASVKGVGYKNVEMIISTQTGFNGQKLVEKESGSGNVITERTELEAERQLDRARYPRYWNAACRELARRCACPTGTSPNGLHQLHKGS